MTQKEALDILKTGMSAFITGAAGSGKTYLLNQYIAWLREHDVPVAITASTGIAATHMGGMTIHSWSGIGIRDTLTDADADALAEKTYLRNQVRNAQVLIIDEVSMLHHYRLDMVDRAVRALRGNQDPFGGMQVILAGDFFQLPPVTKRPPVEQQSQQVIQWDEEESEDSWMSKFVYHSNAWKNLNPAVCYLEEQYRQEDTDYLAVLNAIRDNAVTKKHVALLETRIGAPILGVEEPTKLYALNVNVDAENARRLALLNEKEVQYEMSGTGPDPLVMALTKGCLAPELLRLKVGAKVMFVKNNFEEGYVNGTTGVVVHCDGTHISVKIGNGTIIEVEPASWSIEENGKIKAQVEQYPLRLAWAITVHKSQGITLDAAEIDLSKPFERGMGYVALSRVKSLKGLSLKGLHPNSFLVHEEAASFDEAFREASAKHVKDIGTLSRTKLEEGHARFATIAGGKKMKDKKKPTRDVTAELFASGKNIKEIAKERAITVGTVLTHFEEIKEADPAFSFYALRQELSATKLQKIIGAFQKLGTQEGGKRPLGPVYEYLGGKVPYDELRLVRLLL